MRHRTARVLMIVLAWPLATVSCGDLRDSSPTPQEAQFEFKNDDHGRLVRLDKRTGEITVVEDPAAHTAPATSRRREKRKPVAAPRPDPAVPAKPSACGEEHARRVTVAAEGAPVFIYPRVLPTPLVNLPSGTELPVVESAGSWYRVQFEDENLGPRQGYIHCASVVAPRTSAGH